MKTSYIAIGAVVLIIIGGAVWYTGQKSTYQQPSTQIQTPGQRATSQPSTQQPVAQSPSGQTAKTVTIASFSFQPADQTVALGTTVTWTNNDSMSHTMTADDGSFDSGPIAQGGTFSHTFTTTGSQAYHCQFHSSMHGSITVTE